MAEIKDYLPGGKLYKGPEVDVLDEQIEEAGKQQEEREASTPDNVDWQKRYKDLEVAYSRQGQQIGDYRKLIDEFVSTTPDESADDSDEVSPITPDDIYENPDEAVRRAVDSHPAIKRAKELEKELEATKRLAIQEEFNKKHPTFQTDVSDPKFANWVHADPTRVELALRADRFDMIAADALFTLYEATKTAKKVERQTSSDLIDQVGLESGSGAEAPAPERYSRSEMLAQKIRAKQGDAQAEAYVRAHATRYRNALAAGNVRD